ncbi:MAG TPA: PQQ-binding-like beta-propeller repeat protein, partial [Jatrophihabitantaceae bacterium]
MAGLGRAFVLPLSGRITSQILAADGLFFVTSNGGDVVAFDGNGFVRWRQNVGQLAHSCGQLDG